MLRWMLVVVLLAGCASKGVDQGYVPSAGSSEGLVVFSLTQDQKPGSGIANFFVYYGEPGLLGGRVQVRNELLTGLGTLGAKPFDFPNVDGNLYALKLPAGEHVFRSWQIFNGRALRIYPKEDPNPIRVVLKPGEVRYIGNFHANLTTVRNNLLAMDTVTDGYAEIRDERVRDAALFETRFPQLKGKLLGSPERTGPWVKLSDRTKMMDPVPVIPVVPPTR